LTGTKNIISDTSPAGHTCLGSQYLHIAKMTNFTVKAIANHKPQVLWPRATSMK